MIRTALTFVLLSALAIGAGCGTNKTSGNSPTVSKLDLEHINDKTQIDPPNELGYSKISIRYGDEYKEGGLDARQKEVIAPSKEYLVQDITGDMALLQLERKFLFVPRADGPYSDKDFALQFVTTFWTKVREYSPHCFSYRQGPWLCGFGN